MSLIVLGIINKKLVSLRNIDLFAFGIVKSVHGINAGKHREAPVAHEGEEQGKDDADQEPNGHHVLAVPCRTEVVLDVECLQLNIWQCYADPGMID